MTPVGAALFVVDNSALARLRHGSVRKSWQRWTDVTGGGERSVAVQRTEVGVSARNARHFDQLMAYFDDRPLLPSDTCEVRATARAIQRSLVLAGGLHRAVKVVDLHIAAVAVVHGATVLHYDADYDAVAQVEPRLQASWIVPRGSVP